MDREASENIYLKKPKITNLRNAEAASTVIAKRIALLSQAMTMHPVIEVE